MDKAFWQNRYSTDKTLPTEPSLFAQYCLDFMWPGDIVIDLGCGAFTRDSNYFALNGVEAYAIDQVPEQMTDFISLNYIQGDFTSYGTIKNIIDNRRLFTPTDNRPFDVVYSRFSWHSITSAEEDRLINWMPYVLKYGGLLLIECRTIYDTLYGKGEEIDKDTFIYQGHHRRFINPEDLDSKLKKAGFLTKVKCCKGFAPHKEEDPVILRIIARNR